LLGRLNVSKRGHTSTTDQVHIRESPPVRDHRPLSHTAKLNFVDVTNAVTATPNQLWPRLRKRIWRQCILAMANMPLCAAFHNDQSLLNFV